MKSKKIKSIESSNDYINKIINSNNNKTIIDLKNKYQASIEDLKKTRNKYIKLINSIEATKEAININENELITLREQKFIERVKYVYKRCWY